MMVWHSPWAFFLIVPVILAATYYFLFRKRLKATLRFSSAFQFEKLDPGLRARVAEVPSLLKIISLALIVVALARPQIANNKVKRDVEGIDIMITFDSSDSMLIEDMKPENRLESAKTYIEEFVKHRVSDRIGLVVFSGEAYTRVPLTLDYPMLMESVRDVETSRNIKMGTAIGVALAGAVARLKDSTAKSKVIVFLTDGENNTGTIDPETALEIAKTYGIKIYTIGIGRDGEAQLPVIVQDFRGRKIKQYRPIHSAVNDELLGRMATETGGRYWRATSGQALQNIFQEIDQLEKTKIESSHFTRYDELFARYLLWALLSFLAAFALEAIFLRKAV